MKKTVVRLLSLLLAIVLSVCALPLMAFATEADTHDHGACCGENEAVALGICKHVFQITISSRSEPYNVTHHKSYETEIKTCSLCGYTIRNDVGSYVLKPHTVQKWVLVSQTETQRVYEGRCIYCGQILRMTY